MRRLNGWLHAGLGIAIGSCLVAGCIPAPNRAKLPGQAGQEGIVRSAMPPVLGSATNIAGRVPGLPNVMAPPLQAPSVISNNGGNILKGSVRAPATIISHNGGNIVSNNGGGIVSNNGGGIISHNGGNLQIAQLPLAFTTVRVKDAAGQPVKDGQGRELVAKTDANGNYSFPVEVKGRNLVIEADVDGQNGKLKSLLPKDGVKAGGSLDVDMTSTLTLAYILDQYVKGDLNTFERLPKDIEAKARVVTEDAIVEKQIALPTTLDDGAIVAKVDEVRKAEPKVDQVFEEIRQLLIIAGIVNEGDGLKATDVNIGSVGGATTDPAGNIYVFSQGMHTLWKITPDGVLHTLVPKGAWGFPEREFGFLTPGFTSGLVWRPDGSLILADTYNHRVLRISATNRVSVIAGTGTPGFGGDGGPATLAQVSMPSGLAIDALGNIFVSDTENHRVRKIQPDGNVQTVIGDGTPGYIGDGGPGISARVNRPQGLLFGGLGELYVADYENSRVRVLRTGGTIDTMATQGEPIHSPIALAWDEGLGLICLSHWAGDIYHVTNENIQSILGAQRVAISFPRTLVAQNSRRLVDNGNVFGAIEADNSFTRLLGRRSGVDATAGQEKLHFVNAYKMVVDGDENIFVTDIAAKKILKVSANGEVVGVVGNGTDAKVLTSNVPTEVGIGMVAGISLSNDRKGLIFTSIGDFTAVRHFEFSGKLSTIAGTGKPNYSRPPIGAASSVELANSYEIVQLSDGTIVFSMPGSNYILAVSPDGKVEHFIDPSTLSAPDCLAVNLVGELVFVEENAGRISVRTEGRTRVLLEQSVLGDKVAIGQIRGIVFDSNNNLYLAGENRVLRFGLDRNITMVAGPDSPYLNGTTRDDGLSEISDIAISPSGNLYILAQQQIKRITAEQLSRL
jgi:sugar lactone lactonase YvrE